MIGRRLEGRGKALPSGKTCRILRQLVVSLMMLALSSCDVMAAGRGSSFANSRNSAFSFSLRLRAAFLLFSFIAFLHRAYKVHHQRGRRRRRRRRRMHRNPNLTRLSLSPRRRHALRVLEHNTDITTRLLMTHNLNDSVGLIPHPPTWKAVHDQPSFSYTFIEFIYLLTQCVHPSLMDNMKKCYYSKYITVIRSK